MFVADWMARRLQNCKVGLVNAVHDREAFASRINSAIVQISDLLNQGAKELQKWFAKNRMRERFIRKKGPELVTLLVEPEIILRYLLSRTCRKEVVTVNDVANRLKSGIGIKLETRTKGVSSKRSV